MKSKNMLVSIGRFALSAVLALAVLTVFCLLYYNIPVHYTCEDGATDYSFEPNVFYSRATEGFSMGKINNEGYSNLYDYEEGMQVDVLLMGSSNMDAFHVDMSELTSSRLDEMLGDERVYNIGITAHSFITCTNNLEAALEKYKPTKYVVMEATTITFPTADVENTLNGTYAELASHTGGIVGLLQQNQYLRLLYSQVQKFSNQNAAQEAPAADTSAQNTVASPELLDALMAKINETASKAGVEVIIFCHPDTTLDRDGNLVLGNSEEDLSIFRQACENNGIRFLDMGDRFMQEYNENYILPHGFANSSVGSGHINKYGHQMIAEELYKIMKEAK
ncbi:MAG: hypothetical protein IJO48_05275 [Clostridia bacterium]|nr:hypothetical protein [Clostridia bacterium]